MHLEGQGKDVVEGAVGGPPNRRDENVVFLGTVHKTHSPEWRPVGLYAWREDPCLVDRRI